MKTQSWKFQLNGVSYTVEATARELTVTPGETYKIAKLKRTGNMFDQQYAIPVADSLVYLHIDMLGKKKLVVNGLDLDTGNEYIPVKLPAWGWVFVVLYIVNFFAVLGGALGGAGNALFIWLTVKIISDNTKKTPVRVLLCTGLYILATIVEFLIAILFATALYR